MVNLKKSNTMKLLLILIMLHLVSNRSKNKIWKDDGLSLKRTDYNGHQLKIDGYYYDKYGNPELFETYILYRNGIILNTGVVEKLKDLEQVILNPDMINKLKGMKDAWGVFKIEGNTIQFERWYPGDPPLKSYIRSGVIINDTTFQITKSMRSNGEDLRDINEIYHFKQFSLKPDSTNNFVQ